MNQDMFWDGFDNPTSLLKTILQGHDKDWQSVNRLIDLYKWKQWEITDELKDIFIKRRVNVEEIKARL